MIDRFISVGENIHCTRIYRTDGKFVRTLDDGTAAIVFATNGREQLLPIPSVLRNGADWTSGKVRHCAAAMWQGLHGDGDAQAAGIAYLEHLAVHQERHQARYLDINVDEFSTDVAERVKLMEWVVGIVQNASSLPMSIDSSNLEILRAGLKACDTARGRPMLNSISLERVDAIGVAAEFGAGVIASAAGEKDLPSTADGRLRNLDRLLPELRARGISDSAIHIDPLVFPVATDPSNGIRFLESVAAIREKYGRDIHVVAGLSNVSFGMPNRKLLNQVFTRLAIERGADGGIVDPLQISIDSLNGLDTGSKGCKLARAALVGEDEYAMRYIMACRESEI